MCFLGNWDKDVLSLVRWCGWCLKMKDWQPCEKLCFFFWVVGGRGVMKIWLLKWWEGRFTLWKTASPQASLPQGFMDTAPIQGLRLPKLVHAAHWLRHGPMSSTRCKHRIRPSPDQQGRGWCSHHPECLFNREGPESHNAYSTSCPHRPWASLVMQHRAPESEVRSLSCTWGPTGTLLLAQEAMCSGDSHTSHSSCLWTSLLNTPPAAWSSYF